MDFVIFGLIIYIWGSSTEKYIGNMRRKKHFQMGKHRKLHGGGGLDFAC